MKPKSMLAALALGAGAMALAPAPASAQSAPAIRVQPGDTFLLSMDISIADASTVSMEAGAVLGLEIEEMGPQGGVWRWSVEEINIDSFTMPGQVPEAALPLGPGMNRMLSAAGRLATDIDFVCRVDARGACVELLNWPDWRARVEDLALIASGALLLMQDTAPPPSPAALAGKPDAPDAGALSNAASFGLYAAAVDGVVGVLLDNLDGRIMAGGLNFPMMSDVQGQALSVGQTAPVNNAYAMPFGAAPLRFTGTVTLDGVDRAAGVARYSRSARLDSAGAGASLSAMATNAVPPIMAAFGPALPPDALGEDPATTTAFITGMIGAALESFRLEVEETGTAEVDLATGLVRSGTMRQTVRVAGLDGAALSPEQVSTITFTLRPGSLNQPRLGAAAAP